MKQAKQYIDNVLSGVELVSENTKLTVLRHVEDLERAKSDDYPFFFDEKEAGKAISFLRALRHPSGDKGVAGQKFKVQDNQAFITACIFGWRRKSNGLRRFTEVYLEVSRKWGKSLYAAFIEIYTGFYGGVTGAGIFTAATTRDQADEVFRAVQGLCKMLRNDSDKARKSITVGANSVNDLDSGCFIQKVSADAGNLDGKNPICVCIDEWHAHKTSAVKDVMESAQGTWDAPMLFTITTAGFNKEGPCYKVDRPNALSVLRGDFRQDNLFAMIFGHDTDDADGILNLDPDVPEEAAQILKLAKKSNPNLGSTPTEQFILNRVRQARNKGRSTRVDVLTKNFNCWVDAPTIWIPEDDIKAVMRPLDLEDYKGRPCYLGIDLAATSDITACATFFPPYGEKMAALFLKYWLPEDTIEKRQNETIYGQWVESGFIDKIDGNQADYGVVKKHIHYMHDNHNVKGVYFDQWNAYDIISQLTEEGITAVIVRQTFLNMTEPLNWMERAISAKKQVFEINEDPVLLWMFRNIVLATNSDGAIRPNKEKSADKIDGISASATAIFGHITQPAPVTSYLLEEDSKLIMWPK